MTREEALDRLLRSFPKLFFFIQSHKPVKDRKALRANARRRLEVDDSVPLNILHFQVLWLIKEYAGDSNWCLRKDIEKLFLKKHPEKRSTFLDIMDDLDATELIEQSKSGNRVYNNLRITSDGTGILTKKEAERLKNLDDIFKLLTTPTETDTAPLLPELEYESFVTKFEKLADLAWKEIQQNCLKTNPKSKPSKPTGKKKRRSPSHIADCSV